MSSASQNDRRRPLDLSGEAEFADQLSFDERESIRDRLWNDFIVPEIDAVYSTIDPSFHTDIRDPAQRGSAWLERDQKYRGIAMAEWSRRFPAIRYIDGHFYALQLGPGLVLYDGFAFNRWHPTAFVAEVRRWMQTRLDIVNALSRSLMWTHLLNVGLAIVALVALVALFGR